MKPRYRRARTLAFVARWYGELALAQPQALPGRVGQPPAVDRERMAINEAALARVRQKGDGARNVVGGGKAPHRGAALDVGVAVGATALVALVHLGLDPARAHCVDAHTATAPLGGKCGCETEQPVLAGVVGHPVRNGKEPGDGGDVDDATAALGQHQATESPAEQEGPGQVHLKYAAPLLRGG